MHYSEPSFPSSGDFYPTRETNSQNDYAGQLESRGNSEATQDCGFLNNTSTADSLMVSNDLYCSTDLKCNYEDDYQDVGIQPITTSDLLSFAFQIARGMEYLTGRKVLHGDLAARNILLSTNRIIKICDFGLAKSLYKDDTYRKKKNMRLPIKWMAIESLCDRVFSIQSDVWSFGIVLWELFTLAKTPYSGVPPETMYSKLESGYRMEKPLYSTHDVYTLMRECWQKSPALRPTFAKLVDRLGSMLEHSVRKFYVDLNEPYIEMNAKWREESGYRDYLEMVRLPTYNNAMSPACIEEVEPPKYQNNPGGGTENEATRSMSAYNSMARTDPNQRSSEAFKMVNISRDKTLKDESDDSF